MSRYPFTVTGNDPTAIHVADGCGKTHEVKDGEADLCQKCAEVLGVPAAESETPKPRRSAKA